MTIPHSRRLRLLAAIALVALVGCAGSDAQVIALQKSVRALEVRLARAESSDQTLNDKIFVVTAQLDDCRAAIDGAQPQATPKSEPTRLEPVVSSELEAHEPFDPTLPKHLQLVAAEQAEPTVLKIHGDPEQLAPLDVTDVPPPPTLPDPAVAQAQFEAGLEAFRRGEFSVARTTFERFVDEHPVHRQADNAMYWIGECSYELGDYADALTAFRRIVNEYPSSRKLPDAMFKIGTAYEQLQDGQNARRAFERLVKRYPKSAYSELARARLQ